MNHVSEVIEFYVKTAQVLIMSGRHKTFKITFFKKMFLSLNNPKEKNNLGNILFLFFMEWFCVLTVDFYQFLSEQVNVLKKACASPAVWSVW